MSAKVSLPVIVGSILVVGLICTAALAILQACELKVGILSSISRCVSPQEQLAAVQLETLNAKRANLSNEIFELERELGARQCIAALPDPTAPLTQKGWNAKDISMLIGCWNLDTTYRTRDVDTGEIRTYSDWQMCFDTKGVGQQIMRSNTGVICEGEVRAGFKGSVLDLNEGGNLSCADGGYIHQRQMSCKLVTNGKALCAALQGETGGKADVGFERAPNQIP